ncbi:MAG: 5'/3'-nucleotidase SurE [Actinomycetes bacterium]
MRALVTNDDGISTIGIRTLARVVVDAGLDVIVAAPDREFSGASASFTALESDGRLVVHARPLEGLDGVRTLGVEASPGFIAFAAAHGAFGPPPDLVVSGINHGPNTGQAVLHSGTVGAAMTGTTFGQRALAVSLATARPSEFETAGQVARQALAWLLEQGKPGTVLNVNVPNVPPNQLKGLRHAPLAAFGAVQADIGETGEGYVTMTFSEITAEEDDGSDAALVGRGWATATVLRAPCEATDVDLSGLVDRTVG